MHHFRDLYVAVVKWMCLNNASHCVLIFVMHVHFERRCFVTTVEWDLKEIWHEVVGWINLTQKKVPPRSCENDNEHLVPIEGLHILLRDCQL